MSTFDQAQSIDGRASPSLATDVNQIKTDPYRRAAWRLMPFLGLCLATSSLDRVNVGVAKLQMLHELGWSEAIYGFGAGIFFLGYIPFELPSNAILHRVGAHIWLGVIMVAWGLMSGAMMFVQTPAEYYTLRFLLGVAEAGGLPGAAYYLTFWFPSYRRGRITGFLFLGTTLATLVGGPLSGAILKGFDHAGGLGGWRWLFLIEALPSVFLGLSAYLVLPENPGAARWLSPAEKHRIADDLIADEPRHPVSERHTFMDGLRNPIVWALGGIDFSILITAYVISFWMPTFLLQAGVSDVFTIGLLVAIPSAAGMFGLLFLTASSDRHRERRWHIAVPFLIASASLMTSTFFLHSPAMIVVTFTIAGMMVIGCMGVFFTLPATFLKGPAAAAGFAIACSVANIAGLVSNSLTGLALQFTGSPRSAIWIFALFLIGSSLIVLALPKKLVNR